jgi:pimeloyl-ACP methyl ester carboxylesterase
MTTRALRRLVFAAVALAVAAASLAWAAPALSGALDDYGVVFLHGKGVWPGAFDGGLPGALAAEGAKVVSPEMPWSFNRIYGATYEQALDEVDAAVAGLKAQGARKIVVVGHSLGANAAIGYAATRGPLAAVVAIGPGHLPETELLRDRAHEGLVEAARLIAAGRGNERRRFPDLVQGIPTVVSASPYVYVSMFDPNGPAVIPKNAAAMPPMPLLWVAGMLDPIHARGRDYAYTRAAKDPRSRYVEVFAGHLLTARVARRQIIDWLNSL